MLNIPMLPVGMQQALSGLMGGPAVPAPKFHDVVVVKKKTYAQAKVMGVPPEEFGIERGARTIADCNYCFHGPIPRSQSKLIAEGYDKGQLKTLQTFTPLVNSEEIARDTVDESMDIGGDSQNEAARLIAITEHYIRMDYEGDGKARLYRVVTGGNQGEILKRDGKLDIEEFDSIPFASMTPFIITHRFFGRSVAEVVMDIQKIKTALIRALLDNAYLANNPRAEVAETLAGDNTLDDLLVSRPGGIVRVKQPGAVNWQQIPTIGNHVFPLVEYLDMSKEQRTGVTKQGQGIDANALQNQSATAVNQAFTAAQAKMKLIARIFAETGIKDLFTLLHGVIRKHGQEAQTVRLRNQWVQVNPRDWKTRNDLTVNVGLGTGGKAEQAAHIMQILGLQKEALINGLTNLVQPKLIYNATQVLCRLIGHKDATQFFSDPDERGPDGQLIHPPPQPQPDPKLIELQMKAQLDERALNMKGEIEKVQAAADIETQNRKTAADIALAEKKAALDRDLMMLDAGIKHRQAENELHLKQQDFHNKQAERQQKNEEAKAPKASIEVKHDTDKIAGPLADVVGQFGQHIAKSQETQMQALIAAVNQSHAPRRIVRDPKTGKALGIETVK